MPKPYQAVIFDMDGVLIDTVLLHWSAYNELLEDWYGVSVAESELFGLIGMSLAEQIPILNQKFDIHIDTETFIEAANARKELAMKDLVPKEGVVNLLKDLKGHGISLGVGTSTSEETARTRLNNISIFDYFDVIIGEESVAQHKPNPEVYLRVADALNVQSQHCIVLEDAPSGIRAANDAGMTSVAVQTSYVLPEQLADADHIIQSLHDLSYEKLVLIKEGRA